MTETRWKESKIALTVKGSTIHHECNVIIVRSTIEANLWEASPVQAQIVQSDLVLTDHSDQEQFDSIFDLVRTMPTAFH